MSLAGVELNGLSGITVLILIAGLALIIYYGFFFWGIILAFAVFALFVILLYGICSRGLRWLRGV